MVIPKTNEKIITAKKRKMRMKSSIKLLYHPGLFKKSFVRFMCFIPDKIVARKAALKTEG